MAQPYELGPHRSQGLVDVLDRILDKGLVIAGDIQVRLADVELLTIQIRLLVCSLDKAEEIGMNWWRTDPRLGNADVKSLASRRQIQDVSDKLEQISTRLAELEKQRGRGGGRK